jgi:flagellar basal-body rod protein FlgB
MYRMMFESTAIPVLEQVVNFAQARHHVLAGNIANLDTPGYRVRDLSVEDFQARLRAAIEARHQPCLATPPGQPISPGDIPYLDSPAPGSDRLMGEVAKDPKTILYHDQSNVGIEYQVTEMVKNQMQHNLALTIMARQFRLLEAAISERV